MLGNFLFKIIAFALSAIAGFASIILPKRKLRVTEKKCVFVTGCDSGLGLTIAHKCYELGFFVIAGCLSLESDGAKNLIELDGNKRMIVTEIDIRNNDSIEKARNVVNDLVVRNELIFTALVNNAGVMSFGEFEWQTFNLIENQIQVNLLGTMKLTKVFLPMCRKYNARVVIVTSHCSLQSLPGLAPYGASKAGLRFFIDSLRVEMKKYYVDVVNFIPGSFVLQSNIMSRQRQDALEMKQQFTEEQLEFYNDYFNDYNNYLLQIEQYRKPGLIKDVAMTKMFESALLDVNPHAVYVNQNWRYAIYHFLCGISPAFIRDWLIQRFVQMPSYKPTAKTQK
ncbi:D-beta-hydroxybutyrate dehydrogenase, mitochondrial [Pseudolycoriella hygida]|uniref:D-beta-hydroxybutyrate dehydrogenase, mitochondrial n=1 Tax=Pseudolycoriella hygida TaxID=35572 RepID=A0A9Q0MUF1_9DIPT|nr:D-beta-hydroxybutyrate dehydrogenase, mitochondrial [Pseudolycoriella hygida]